MKITKLLLFLILSSMIYLPAALAQEGTQDPQEAKEVLDTEEEKTNHEVVGSYRRLFTSDVDNGNGEIGFNEDQFRYEYEFLAFDKLPMEIELQIGHIDIEDDGVGVALPNHLESRKLLIGTKFYAPFFNDEEKWFMGVDIIPTMNTDDGDFETSAFRMPIRAYLIYKESEELIVVGGLNIRPGYDSAIVPIIGMIWKPDEVWELEFTSSNPTITYKISDQTKVLAELSFAFDEYEVTRGSSEDVILKYNNFLVGGGIQHDFTKNITGALTAGIAFNKSLEYEDNGQEVEVEAGPYFGFNLTANF